MLTVCKPPAKQAALTNRAGRGMLSPLRVTNAAADRFKGHQPRGVNMKLFLCPEVLPFCVKQETGGAVLQGACTTDRKTALLLPGRENCK